ncbi:MAG: hypothetical protein QM831_27120 [Kofleriaceae bacterium]
MSSQRPSFAKRDREQKLKDKAKQKAERRAERAAQPRATKGPEIATDQIGGPAGQVGLDPYVMNLPPEPPK